MKLWAKRGKWRIGEIVKVSPLQMCLENGRLCLRGLPVVGVPYCYAQVGDERIYVPRPSKYVEIEEES